ADRALPACQSRIACRPNLVGRDARAQAHGSTRPRGPDDLVGTGAPLFETRSALFAVRPPGGTACSDRAPVRHPWFRSPPVARGRRTRPLSGPRPAIEMSDDLEPRADDIDSGPRVVVRRWL